MSQQILSRWALIVVLSLEVKKKSDVRLNATVFPGLNLAFLPCSGGRGGVGRVPDVR